MIRWVASPAGVGGGQWYFQDRLLGTLGWPAPVRHPVIHPLFTLNGQGPVTNFAPFDHPWHHGLWWSWKTINGVNYWEDNGTHGFGACRVVRQKDHSSGPSLELELCPLGTVPGAEPGTFMAPVMREKRQLTAAVVPEWPGAWMLIWRAQFEALEECRLAATPREQFPWGGYAGLNFRPARSLGLGESVVNGERSEGLACHGQRASWAAYSGPLDGNPGLRASAEALAGVALVWGGPGGVPFYCCGTGPANRDFGFLASASLWDGEMRLEAGEQWSFTAAAVVFQGPVEPRVLDDLAQNVGKADGGWP